MADVVFMKDDNALETYTKEIFASLKCDECLLYVFVQDKNWARH